MDINILENDEHAANILVVGVGGCGGNLVGYMRDKPAAGVSYVAVNTDSQALKKVNSNIECIQIGTTSTRGLGAGGDPDVARQAAESERDRLRQKMNGRDMVFVVAGMGKGTGTGASPVVADIARELDILTVALVIMPFKYENRTKQAEAGLRELSKRVDSLIVAPNDQLKEALGADATIKSAMAAANELLYNAVRGISDIINLMGDINVDFNDVRKAMTNQGKAVIGSAVASGHDRLMVATESALTSKLMEDVDLNDAAHIVLNIVGEDNSIDDLERVVQMLKERAPNLRDQITPGLVFDESMSDSVRVTVIVTGVNDRFQPKVVKNAPASDTELDDFFQSGRNKVGAKAAESDGKEHRTPAVLKRQLN